MNDDDPLLTAMIDATSAAAGTLLGLAIGDPAGAVLGAAVAPLMSAAIALGRRALRNVHTLSNETLATSGWSEDELLSRAMANDGTAALTAAVVRGAYRTFSEEKIRALARILVSGLDDDALVDASWVLAATVEELEPPHVTVLATMVNEPGLAAFPNGVWDRSSVMRAISRLAPAILPIMAMTTRLGLTSASTPYGGVGEGAWTVTDYGREVLAHLSAMAEG